jgi:hypothetical protein
VNPASLRFKVATEAAEFDQIHALNYRTFAEEIPQHPPNPERRLVDRFHAENTYLVCVAEERLLGMLAVRGKRPFSLDGKLARLDRYLPPGRSVCEIRLLAVEPDRRAGRVLRGLLELLRDHSRVHGYDLGVVSATVRQERLYRHLGFVAFGPRVGTPEAPYQPMYVTRDAFEAALPAPRERKKESGPGEPGTAHMSGVSATETH